MKIRWIYITIAIVLQWSCGPVYQIREVYIPPTEPDALACAKACSETRTQCDTHCRTEYQQCSRQAELDAVNTLSTAFQIYTAELSAYRVTQATYAHNESAYLERKAHFEHQLDISSTRCQKNNEQACNKTAVLRGSLKGLYHHYFSIYGPLYLAPQPPIKPSLEAEADYLRKNRCNINCSCKDHFSICYQNCGGQINSRRICVSGC